MWAAQARVTECVFRQRQVLHGPCWWFPLRYAWANCVGNGARSDKCALAKRPESRNGLGHG